LIAILDYGSGNLRSAERAFAAVGEEVVVTNDPQLCASADGLVIPGVGAFKACMDQLIAIKGDQIIKNYLETGRKILGICVGMQILFTKGFEKQESDGLAVLNGEIRLLDAQILPHIGWNSVSAGAGSELFKGLENERFYFVHSYGLQSPVIDGINTTSTYDNEFISAVERENISAVQFHPEKSGDAGLALIKNWVTQR
jgi:imidazole glycerol-phosphate synthase subunit HisH